MGKFDEVDSATNNQVFIHFLAQLRENYLRLSADMQFQQEQAGRIEREHRKRKTPVRSNCMNIIQQ